MAAVSRGTTIAIIAGTLTLFGLGGLYSYCRYRAAREPFSADAYLAKAIASARDEAADAELSVLRVEIVDPQGMVAVEHRGMLYAYFRSPSHRAPGDEPAVLGAPRRSRGCPRIAVVASVHGARSRHFEFETAWRDEVSICEPSSPAPLRCTVVDVWRRAIAQGAPTPALADIALDTRDDGTRAWTFAINDRVDGFERNVFRAGFPDDCPTR